MIRGPAPGSCVGVCKVLRFLVYSRGDKLQFTVISDRAKKLSDIDLLIVAKPGGLCERCENGFGGLEPLKFDQYMGHRNLIVDSCELHGSEILERCFLRARSIRKL